MSKDIAWAPIVIERILTDEVTLPRNDGTPGSALYAIHFQLSRAPSALWCRLFVENWNHPPQFTSMHRSGIAKVMGDTIILDGTTMEEVRDYHTHTLKLVVNLVNQLVLRYESEARQREEDKRASEKKERENISEIAKKIKFD